MKTRIVDNINDNQTLSKKIDDKKITIIVFFAVAVLCLAALAIGVVNVSNRYVKDLINRCEKMEFVTGFITSSCEELVYTDDDYLYCDVYKYYEYDNIDYLTGLYSVLSKINFKNEGLVPTDAQFVRFYFVDSEDYAMESFTLAYDFHLEKVLILNEGKWYSVKDDSRISSYIPKLLDKALSASDFIWRGQSTFALEEWVEADFENATFRYNLYWVPDVRPWNCEFAEWRGERFVNTEPAEVKTKDQALALAAKELGFTEPVGVTFYDETCGYWMVEMYDAVGGYKSVHENNEYLKLPELCRTVIISDKGITLEVYKSVTRFRPFMEPFMDGKEF
jgi:hypothetical protein